MYLPQIDVCERAGEIVILIELPGVAREDVQISWNDKVLTIAGVKKQHLESGIANYLCVERSYGHFRREIVIGIPVDYRRAKAELRDGLMKVCLPKVRDEERRIAIPIE